MSICSACSVILTLLPCAKAGGAPGTPSFHSQETFFKSCTLCHNQIHGSNFDRTFLQVEIATNRFLTLRMERAPGPRRQ